MVISGRRAPAYLSSGAGRAVLGETADRLRPASGSWNWTSGSGMRWTRIPCVTRVFCAVSTRRGSVIVRRRRKRVGSRPRPAFLRSKRWMIDGEVWEMEKGGRRPKLTRTAGLQQQTGFHWNPYLEFLMFALERFCAETRNFKYVPWIHQKKEWNTGQGVLVSFVQTKRIANVKN